MLNYAMETRNGSHLKQPNVISKTLCEYIISFPKLNCNYLNFLLKSIELVDDFYITMLPLVLIAAHDCILLV